MTDNKSLRDRYLELIDQIVQATLKGKIRSKEQVYQMLLQGISSGTGEIFEQCLEELMATTQQQIDTPESEYKQAKALRSMRALKTINGEWQRVQQQKQVSQTLTNAVTDITTAQPSERLNVLLRLIDPNQEQVLSLQQLTQLAKTLNQHAQETSDPQATTALEQLSTGIRAGIASWQQLESDLISWIYEQSRGSIGFEGTPEQRGPWIFWSKRVSNPVPKSLFQTLGHEQPLDRWARQQPNLGLDAWVELAIVLQYLQRGLVAWSDKMIYDSKLGAKLSISTYIAFAIIWSQLASACNQTLNTTQKEGIVNGCFQVSLQILRAFAQQSYFPLYGGVFASLSGKYLNEALTYLDEPLRRVEGTQEKARILTLLGYSSQVRGQYDRAEAFHQQALDIARQASDRLCEIANLNHLSRMYVAQKQYGDAINTSQRALMLSRSSGDKLGEANALANLGYSEVFQAQQQSQLEPEVYENAIYYLQQGQTILERLGDAVAAQYSLRQSQALCLSSLGIAHVIIQKPQEAVAYLEQGLQAAQLSGDLYLQGLTLAYLAQAFYRLHDLDSAIYRGCLGTYLLEQIGSEHWRQGAALLAILQGQIGKDAFQSLLQQQRPKIIPFIGVDGYDYLPKLIEKYRETM